mgnify:CR=1 FL=1
MNISLNWGGNLISLPQSNDYLVRKLTNYITSDKKGRVEFMNNYSEAIGRLPADNPDLKEDQLIKEFKQQFKALFNKALDTKIKPKLVDNTGAWRKFAYGRKVIKDGKDTTPINERRVAFAEDLTFKDLKDLAVRDTLVGQGVLSVTQKDGDIPPFDFNEWVNGFEKRQSLDSIQESTMVEVILRPNPKGDQYLYSHDRSVNSEDAHLVGYLPIRSISGTAGTTQKAVNELKEAQLDWIVETTGAEAFYTPNERKINFPLQEAVEYPIIINQAKNPKLPPQLDMKRSKTGQSSSWQQRISEETHKPLGTKEYINAGTEHGNWLMKVIVEGDGTKAGGHNTQELYDKNMFMEGGELFSFKIAQEQENSFDGEELKEFELSWGIDDADSPYSFIYDNIALFKEVIRDWLNDPLLVTTVKIKGNIKLSKNLQSTMGERMKDTNAANVTEKNPEPDRYQVDKYKRKTGKGRTLTTTQYNNLSEKRKTKYDKIEVDMTPQEIDAASKTGFKLKTDASKTISEKEYHTLGIEEKKKYVSNIQAYGHTGKVGGLIHQTSGKSGEMNYTSGNLEPDEIISRFKDATIVTSFEIIQHGEYKLPAIGDSGGNIEMSKMINGWNNNIVALRNKLPQGD